MVFLKQKDNHVSHITFDILAPFDTMTCIALGSDKAEALSFLLEKQQGLFIRKMLRDGQIASDKLHVTTLPLTIVFHDTIGPNAIVIPVRRAAISGDYEDNIMPAGCNNAALLLTAKTIMQIFSPVIDPTGNKLE
ncbi:MAG: hypothetical protein DI616_04290 [Paracoccus denitrificans]|uniref:Uncharacterized protein n=1 Tax=Paracoccus denitrificans TaxID=266 RepID=A0A533I9U7_PARDE|nr:MAG: hypothetical protein DI616_04290 [Paracoccus denitrificans]